MSWSLRSLLVLLAALAASANVQAAGKGRKPAAHHAAKASAKRGRPAAHHAAHHAAKPARHVSHTKVKRLARPAVHRHSARHAQRSTKRTVKPAAKTAGKTAGKTTARRAAAARTTHRYPVNRVQRNVVINRYYYIGGGRRHHHRRYSYSYYPGRYAWRSNYYNRGSGGSRRRGSRGVAGIVELVQGNANAGTLQVKTLRSRSSRFRYGRRNAAAAVAATSHHRFLLNLGTRYEVMTVPSRKGTIADLRPGEHVLILRHPRATGTAQKVEVLARRRGAR